MKTVEGTYKIESELKIVDDIINKVSYFEVFNYPLKFDEISNLLSVDISEEFLKENLDQLVKDKVLYSFEDFYSLTNDLNNKLESRLAKEKHAQKYFEKSKRYVKLISRFPYVRGIAFSGSLSKGLMAQDGDIDYFIITQKERLWFARMLLIIYKKVILLNSRKYFCVNYFVDEENLEIKDKNIFTATEIAYLIPAYGEDWMFEFDKKNSWTSSYYPKFNHPIEHTIFRDKSKFKVFLEKIFNGSVGNKLDLLFMRITLKRWRKKFEHFDEEKFEITLRTERGISKHHPRDFQNQVLSEWEQNKSNTLNKINI